MTFDNLCLQSLKPSEQHIISTTNSIPSYFIGEGSVTLTEQIGMDFVLVVPTRNHNLLSVAQRTLTL